MPDPDFVINVRQVSQYPLKASADTADAVLLQEGGLGGAYKYTTPLGLLNPLKTDTLTAGSVAVAANLGWVNGPQWLYAGQNVALLWTDNTPLLTVSPGGSWLDSDLSLISGTVTVTRDPTAPLEVATQQFVLDQIYNSGVRSFNGSRGDVQFGLWDMLQLGALPAQNPQLVGAATLNGKPLATTDDVKTQLESYAPLVNLFNGRAGVVELQLVDVMNVFFAGVPITPTPRSSDISQRIANTRWVTDRNEELYGSLWADVSRKYAPLDTPHLIGIPTTVTPDINDNSNQIATTAWVINKLTAIGAGVLTWNNRSGVVNLLWSDVDAVGGAPIASPVFTGNPQAPTRVKTDNSASIATTAFVQSVAGDYLPLVGGTLTGPVTGTALTLSGALGVAGATALAGILGVVGAATFDATLDVTGAVTLDDTLDVTGAVTLSDTLDVTGVLTGTWANFTTNSAVPAITALTTAAGPAIDATGSATGFAIRAHNSVHGGIYVDKASSAGTGIYLRSANAGVSGTYISVAMDGTASVGLSVGSPDQTNSAIEVWRWTPDITRRWWVTHDGSTHELYDGTGNAVDINNTGTGNALLIHNAATNYLSVNATGHLTLSNATGVNNSFIMNATGNVNNNIIGRKAGANRWRLMLGDSTPESGGDTGSNFTLMKTTDAGVELPAVFRIMRDTGRAFFYNGIDQAGIGTNTYVGSGVFNNTATGTYNIALGFQTMRSIAAGTGNIGIGYRTLDAAVTSNHNVAIGHNCAPLNTGSGNVAIGTDALMVQTAAANNTAVGRSAMAANTTAGNNTAVGYQALSNNATGASCTAIGYQALLNNTAGSNVAIGSIAMQGCTSGSSNTAVGSGALRGVLTTNNHVAVGANALQSLTSGTNNTAVGTNALRLTTVNSNNVAVGYNALQNNTGGQNTAVGYLALAANTSALDNTAVGCTALEANTTGNSNTAVGRSALEVNTAGAGNIAIGFQALFSNISGVDNVAVGSGALRSSTSRQNTGVGHQALYAMANAGYNTAVGYQALRNNNGNSNTAVGWQALADNLTAEGLVAVGYNALAGNQGANNTAVGSGAMQSNTTGVGNVAVGRAAMVVNSTGNYNVAIGLSSLTGNTIGSNNVVIGVNAMWSNVGGTANIVLGVDGMRGNTNGNYNVGIGEGTLYSLTAGSQNVAIGRMAGTTAAGAANALTNSETCIYIGVQNGPAGNVSANEIVIGNYAVGRGSGTAQFGGTNPVTGLTSAAYWGNGTNPNWSTTSDARLKRDIHPADLEQCVRAVLALPVSRWEWAIDTIDRHVTGWTADDVERVFPKAVLRRDSNGFADLKSITMTEALPTLWGAVQRLIERLEALERKS